MKPIHSDPAEILGIVIADIHLQPNDSHHPINQHFLDFLEIIAPQSKALYILGDLFEVWLGDDIGLVDYSTEIHAIKKLIDSGTQVFVQYGNRDFLMRTKFCQRTGIQLLPEEYPAEIGKHKMLMVHGDQLCTLDSGYQKMRKWFRKPWVQWLFLHLPKSKRIQIGHSMRQNSQNTGRSKPDEMMDTVQRSVENLMQHYPGYHTLIHGHTHKPALNHFMLDSKTYSRYVLSDWRPQTEYLEITNTELFIKAF